MTDDVTRWTEEIGAKSALQKDAKSILHKLIEQRLAKEEDGILKSGNHHDCLSFALAVQAFGQALKNLKENPREALRPEILMGLLTGIAALEQKKDKVQKQWMEIDEAIIEKSGIDLGAHPSDLDRLDKMRDLLTSPSATQEVRLNDLEEKMTKHKCTPRDAFLLARLSLVPDIQHKLNFRRLYIDREKEIKKSIEDIGVLVQEAQEKGLFRLGNEKVKGAEID